MSIIKILSEEAIISQISLAAVMYVRQEDLALTPAQSGRAWLEFFMGAVEAVGHLKPAGGSKNG